MIYGDSIRLARESRGLERDELAAKVAVGADVLAAWEEDRVKPTIFQQQRLSFALQYPARFFQVRHPDLAAPSSLDWHSFEYTCDACNKPIESRHDHEWAGERDYHVWCKPLTPAPGPAEG